MVLGFWGLVAAMLRLRILLKFNTISLPLMFYVVLVLGINSSTNSLSSARLEIQRPDSFWPDSVPTKGSKSIESGLSEIDRRS